MAQATPAHKKDTSAKAATADGQFKPSQVASKLQNKSSPPLIDFRWLSLLFIACTLAACGGSRVVNHSFEFDTRNSIPLAEILDYRYGNSKLPVHAPEWIVKEGRPLYFNAVAGPMLVGDFLYVKWRIKDTGLVYEDTVDLRHRLPFFLRNKTVYFDIKGSQLYVYVISPERRPENMLPNGPPMYHYRKVITIYPDQPKH